MISPPRARATLAIIALTFGGLSACSGTESEPSNPAAAPATTQADGNKGGALKNFASCDEVGSVFTDQLGGLTLVPASSVEPGTIDCAWTSASTTPGSVTLVGVSGQTFGDNDIPDMTTLEDAGRDVVPQPQIEAAGGIAYTEDSSVPEATTSITQVDTPLAHIAITSTQYGGAPELRGGAAADTAAELLSR